MIKKLTDPYFATGYEWGPFYADIDSFSIHNSKRKDVLFSIHVDHWWSYEVLNYWAPPRIYLSFWFGYFIFGLPDNKTEVIKDNQFDQVKSKWHWERAQKWSPKTGYGNYTKDNWRVITFSPNKRYLCETKLCGKLKNHKGNCVMPEYLKTKINSLEEN